MRRPERLLLCVDEDVLDHALDNSVCELPTRPLYLCGVSVLGGRIGPHSVQHVRVWRAEPFSCTIDDTDLFVDCCNTIVLVAAEVCISRHRTSGCSKESWQRRSKTVAWTAPPTGIEVSPLVNMRRMAACHTILMCQTVPRMD